MKKSTVLRVAVSCLFIVVVLAFSIHHDIKQSRQYLNLLFEEFSAELQSVGENNVNNAQQVQDIFSGKTSMDINAHELAQTSVHYYPQRNEYGFNQGVYPTVSANGTLIGYGKPPTKVSQNSKRFLLYDKVWNSFENSNRFNDHFVANYKYNYIYSSKIRDAANRPRYLAKDSLTPDSYRRGIEQDYRFDLEKYNYFFSLPFNSLLDGERVFSIVTPLYSKGEHIADMGTDIYLTSLQKLMFIYPEIKNRIAIDLTFHHSNITVPISEAAYSSWEVLSYEFAIPNLGTLTAHYDWLYFVQESGSILVMMVMLVGLINSYRSSLRRHKREKHYLNQQIIIDPMTGLYNRRILDLDVETALQEKHQINESVCMIAIDANKFKQINDQHGHQVGDKAITFISESIKACTRETDYSIRMGGDEFLILLPDAELEDTKLIAIRLEQLIKSTSVKKVGVYVSVTTAVTKINPYESFDDAYKRIDTELYVKKGVVLSL